MFPASLQNKYQDFSNLYDEINKLIGEDSKDDSFNLYEKKSALVEKIQSSCTNVLEEAVQSAQTWLKNAQEEVKNQITNLEEAREQV